MPFVTHFQLAAYSKLSTLICVGPGQRLAQRAFGTQSAICLESAPVAQLDRANASGALGREFESLRAHHIA